MLNVSDLFQSSTKFEFIATRPGGVKKYTLTGLFQSSTKFEFIATQAHDEEQGIKVQFQSSTKFEFIATNDFGGFVQGEIVSIFYEV